ncbi:MAG: STAS domain-containing protein [Solirubrobacterales bacterium]
MNGPGETVVVALEGEIDLSTAPEAERRILDAAGGSPARIVIDLREVTFMDSSGVRVLLSAHRDAESNGRSFAIVKGNSAVDRLLEVTGLAERLELLDAPPD